MGLAAHPREDTTALSTESHDGDHPIRRRHLLRGAPATGLTAPALVVLTPLRARPAGRQDPLVDGGLLTGWARHTAGGCMVLRLDGGHVALSDRVPWLSEVIRSMVERAEPVRPAPLGGSSGEGEGHGC
jgi:hypothetical protein